LDDKIDSIDIAIIHPSMYTATSNGVKKSAFTTNNVTTTVYKHRYPIASYLVAFSVTNFVTFSHTIQLGNVQLPMISHVYPEDLALFQNNTQPVIECMKILHEKYGGYPFINEQYTYTIWLGRWNGTSNQFFYYLPRRKSDGSRIGTSMVWK
jgi:aminopeptidase N